MSHISFMKKIYSLFCVIALCIVSVSFVSCSGSDPIIEEEEKPIQTNYAKFVIKASEDMFELGDFIITLEYDGKKETYTLNEQTKVSDINFEGFNSFFGNKKVPGRMLEIAPFKFDAHPVKYTGEFVISEEGKKRIASAPKEDQIDFAVYAKLQSCNKDGVVVFAENPRDECRAFPGTYVNDVNSILETLKSYNYNAFGQILK